MRRARLLLVVGAVAVGIIQVGGLVTLSLCSAVTLFQLIDSCTSTQRAPAHRLCCSCGRSAEMAASSAASRRARCQLVARLCKPAGGASPLPAPTRSPPRQRSDSLSRFQCARAAKSQREGLTPPKHTAESLGEPVCKEPPSACSSCATGAAQRRTARCGSACVRCTGATRRWQRCCAGWTRSWRTRTRRCRSRSGRARQAPTMSCCTGGCT